MDKDMAKRIARTHGIPVAESKVMNRHDFTSTHPMRPPYVVKPVAEGSSFGVVIVKEDQPHPPQIITSPNGNTATG
jgi:D-alanine-D-alanine ligase